MARTFPAVIINGILESGKTTFIIDSLKNGDFGDIGKVLIISTEDGEIEFDNTELAKYNAVAHVVSSPEDFTVQNINDLIRINKPHAVFFEMNAMWDWEKLQFPPYILIEQTFTNIKTLKKPTESHFIRPKKARLVPKKIIEKQKINQTDERKERVFGRSYRIKF